MSETCDNNCSSCASAGSCADVNTKLAANDQSRINKVIGIVSGKGGVGKSMVTSLLAVNSSRAGKRTAILDADLTGPSIPQIFGIHGRVAASPEGLVVPMASETGINVVSINLLLEDETDPVVWRGALLNSVVSQFWTEVAWGDVDYMFVDMPPGTGDVPLTVFQSLPLDGIVVVTSPQEMVGMIVEKAVKLAEMMDVPILGIVENMAYFQCPNCGEKHEIFGKSNVNRMAEQYGIDTVEQLPLDPALAALCDQGKIEWIPEPLLQTLGEKIRSL